MVVFQRDPIFQDYVEHASQVVVKKLAEEVTNDDDKLAFIDELALLQKIRHPNVVQFLGAVTQSSPMMIVTEYLPKGNLCAYMKEGGQLKPLKAVRFALDIARSHTVEKTRSSLLQALPEGRYIICNGVAHECISRTPQPVPFSSSSLIDGF
ncbi:hypothetical protein POM88_045413 [Heracleum sosnowskyi]|uniref:Protein kinase domain-containing protein n=1 Tax=Heracleum sosnowskyi TaxID=360622 RepID=A0AAD8H5P3_9APIA|nr:hypothetical protein POM88_045413 [Heracleum sosnowskyi]